MPAKPKCRGYPFLECEGDGIKECYNESCARTNKCCSTVLVSEEALIPCGKAPHKTDDRHYVEVKEHFGSTMIAISWPSRKDPFDARTMEPDG